jgi:hypothetical protein
MKTITYTTYAFSELSDGAKKNAIQWYKDNIAGQDSFWADCVIENWQESLSERGYDSAEINYSGFWSQGDGASFTANVDVRKWLKYRKLSNAYRSLYNDSDYVSAKVIRISNHYSHENTVTGSVEYDGYSDKASNQSNELENAITEDVRQLSREIYKELESAYEWEFNDECVTDNLLANDDAWEFTAEGYYSKL